MYILQLFATIDRYHIQPSNTYNMDEKGMMIGKVKKHQRIFTKKHLRTGKILGVNESGNREWITLLATICGDGSPGKAMLIYPSEASALQDTWLQAYKHTEMDVSFSSTASGWTNDTLGLEWLKHFEQWSRDRMADPSKGYRLLILDGHGSHCSLKFQEICYQNRIVLAWFPSHSTHRLQPLDIGMFRPFAMRYSLLLDQWYNDRMGLCNFTKREFFQVFWPAYVQSFTTKNILSAWEKSGIFPRNAARIVNVVDQPDQSSRPSTSYSGSSTVSIHAYIKIIKKVRFQLAGTDDDILSSICDLFRDYQSTLSIAEHERDGYKRAVVTEKARRARSKPLINAGFIEKYGESHIMDAARYELKLEYDAQQDTEQREQQLAKEAKKQAKQQMKEQLAVLNAQRKAQKQENALQRKIAADDRAREKALKKAGNQAIKAANLQLQSDLKLHNKVENTKGKPFRGKTQCQEVVVVDDDDNDEGSSRPPTTTRTRAVHRPKRFES